MGNTPNVRFKGFTEDWEQRKLGELCQITMGQSPDGSTYSEEPSDFILVQGNADLKDGWVYPRIWTTQKTKTAQAGDLIMSVRAPAGAMGKTAYDVVLGRGVAGIKGNEFVYQSLIKMDSDGYWKKMAAGSTFESINSDVVKNAEMIIPQDIEEQEKIGVYFKQLDTLIALHQQKCDETKEFKKYMLQNMFPQKDEKVPKIRFDGFTGDWEQRKLGNIATFINGRAYSQDELLSSGKYKVLRVGNFYTNDSWYYSDMELDDKYYAEEGDLLYTWSATFGPHIWHGDKVIYHYHIWKVELSDALEKNFAVQLMEKDKQSILSDKNGSTMVHITKSGMESKEVILPSNIKEQAKIGEYFYSLDNLITLHQQKCNALKEFKKYMLQNMFPQKGENKCQN